MSIYPVTDQKKILLGFQGMMNALTKEATDGEFILDWPNARLETQEIEHDLSSFVDLGITEKWRFFSLTVNGVKEEA